MLEPPADIAYRMGRDSSAMKSPGFASETVGYAFQLIVCAATTDENARITASVLQIWSLYKYILNCRALASDDSDSALSI